jgi:hypothetical protein
MCVQARALLVAASIAVLLGAPRRVVAQGVTVPVIGIDYAFQLPDTLPAGHVVFALKNDGVVHHQLILYLLNPGRTMTDFVRAPSPQERQGTFEELIGVVAANAGHAATGQLGVDLLRGRTYLFVCNDRDAADKPAHLQLGMVRSLYVK